MTEPPKLADRLSRLQELLDDLPKKLPHLEVKVSDAGRSGNVGRESYPMVSVEYKIRGETKVVEYPVSEIETAIADHVGRSVPVSEYAKVVGILHDLKNWKHDS